MGHKGIFSAVFWVLVSILASGTASAQFNNSNQIGRGWKVKSKEDRPDKKEMTLKVRTAKHVTPEKLNAWVEETNYFKDILVDSLWYVGAGEPIEEKTALNMDRVYRLSMKLNNGKYIHVECLRKGLPEPSDMFCSRLMPVEKYDYDIKGSDSLWVSSQGRITQVYQYPSVDIDDKSIEICCDKDGNMVHSASIEFPMDGRAIVIYNDSMGNIISLTDDERYKTGTIVLVDFPEDGDPVYIVSDIGGWPIQKIQ